MIKRILTTVDGSVNADLASELAADIAAKYGAHLKILHVGLREPGHLKELHEAAERSFQEAESAGNRPSHHPTWPPNVQVFEHMGHMILNKARQRAQGRGATSVEDVLDWGEAGERILHHAKHPAVDMIVMGSRGASPLQGLFLGSVSHKVFHLAPCTCVTVHEGEGKPHPAEFERIVVPFDGSSHALKALELACDLAAKFGASLRVVLVLEGGETPEHLLRAADQKGLDADTVEALNQAKLPESRSTDESGSMPMISMIVVRKVGEQILGYARRTAANKGVTEVDTELLKGDPTHCILDFVAQCDGDLIVMGMRGLGELQGILLGSVSYKVNHLAPCTCITVR